MSRINYGIVLQQDFSPGYTVKIQFRVDSGIIFPYVYKLYDEGLPEPGYGATNVFSNQQITSPALTADAAYRLKIKDANNNEFYLGRINTYNSSSTGASTNELYTDLRVSDTGASLGFVDGTSMYGVAVPAKASLNDGGTRKVIGARGEPFNTPWSNSELESYGGDRFSVLILIGNPVTQSYNPFTDLLLNAPVPLQPLTVTYTETNETAANNNDGTINLFPAGGSGNYTYLWGDGATTQNRQGLEAGVYTVTVTDTTTLEEVDLTIQITEPAPEINPFGRVFEFPVLNPIQHVVRTSGDQCTDPQSLDNRLLCEQRYKNFKVINYYNKVLQCDSRRIQFNSDFQTHVAELREYDTDELVKTLEVELTEENIGQTDDFNISIRPDVDATKSRVYFVVGVPPIPLSVNDVFDIVNNVDGFNGTYTITDIRTDLAYGYQYLVINKAYLIPDSTSEGVGRFLSDAADYNVYEFSIPFLDVPIGRYYVTVTAQSDNIATAQSEPIEVVEDTEGLIEISYRNIDNDYGNITWTTGFIGQVRVEGYIGHKRSPGGERSISRDADYSITKVNAKRTRILTVETIMLPPYLHEKLSLIFDCDEYSINKVPYQSSEGYGEPAYIEAFLLANSNIKVEQKDWLRKYNSDDIGTVGDEGLLITQQGFIKR